MLVPGPYVVNWCLSECDKATRNEDKSLTVGGPAWIRTKVMTLSGLGFLGAAVLSLYACHRAYHYHMD